VTVTKYHSKLVGVTFEGRQDVISDLVGNEQLRFRREPNNEYDANAVAVDAFVTEGDGFTQDADFGSFAQEWLPIGYIAKDKNTELAKVLDDKKYAQIKLKEITGGEDKAYGINVEIEYEKLPVLQTGTTERLTDLFGNQIDYDEVNHIYSWKGEVYESGSQYASKNKKPFDSTMMSNMVAKKTGADPKEIAELWKLGGQVSRDFGTVVHLALEIYGKHRALSESLEKEYHIPNHPVLKDIVESFYKGREDEKAEYEVLVVDHKAKRAGTIDRLQIVAPKTVIIEDFKITHKEDKQYWKDQLGFYQTIIEANGWTVTGREIHQFNGIWKGINV
jgi:hypothetical protein